MAAQYVESDETAWSGLEHHVESSHVVGGAALLTMEDVLAASIRDWMHDPANATTGLYGLHDVIPVDGDALRNGVRYAWKFSDPDTAERFRERWGKVTEAA